MVIIHFVSRKWCCLQYYLLYKKIKIYFHMEYDAYMEAQKDETFDICLMSSEKVKTKIKQSFSKLGQKLSRFLQAGITLQCSSCMFA